MAPQTKLSFDNTSEEEDIGETIEITPINKQIKEDNIFTLYVDVHEPIEIIESFRKEKGIYVKVIPLEAGDYAWSNVLIERKEIRDFYNSIVHGDKHIWKQMIKIKHASERPMLIIERWDESFFTSPRIERTIKGAISSIFLMGISVLIIPGKHKDCKPFVDQVAYMFYSSDKKTLSLRPVPEKVKERNKKEIISDVLSMLPYLGRKQADLIAEQVENFEELCKLSNEDIKKLCPRLGPKRISTLRWILSGKGEEVN